MKGAECRVCVACRETGCVRCMGDGPPVVCPGCTRSTFEVLDGGNRAAMDDHGHPVLVTSAGRFPFSFEPETAARLGWAANVRFVRRPSLHDKVSKTLSSSAEAESVVAAICGSCRSERLIPITDRVERRLLLGAIQDNARVWRCLDCGAGRVA
jgi:hypothetical protein